MCLPRRSVLRSAAANRRTVRPSGSNLPVSSSAAPGPRRSDHLFNVDPQIAFTTALHTIDDQYNTIILSTVQYYIVIL